jgi:hypothetical protein
MMPNSAQLKEKISWHRRHLKFKRTEKNRRILNLNWARCEKGKMEFFLDCPVTLMNAFIRGYTFNHVYIHDETDAFVVGAGGVGKRVKLCPP